MMVSIVKNKNMREGAVYIRLVFLVTCIFISIAPVKVRACETGAQGILAVTTATSVTIPVAGTSATASIDATGYTAAWYLWAYPVHEYMFSMEKAIMAKIDWLWKKWEGGLKAMVKEINASSVDQNRSFGENEDASNINLAAQTSQIQEYESKKQFQPTNQGCVFDSTAKYFNRGDAVKNSAAELYSDKLGNISGNISGSAASMGAMAMQAKRWEKYSKKFCDENSNNGYAGCDAGLSAPNPNANKHIMPSKTILSQDTIDLSDEDTRDAIEELMFNITGYEGSDAVLKGAMSSATGLEERQKAREYATQMDAVSSLVYSLIAERTPVQAAPEILAIREKIGVTNASATPSSFEIRKAIVEQLWDPNYYKELYDAPSTIKQKEIYLKAYSLTMLNELIEKQEKISNVFALETANILQQTNTGQGDAASNAKMQ